MCIRIEMKLMYVRWNIPKYVFMHLFRFVYLGWSKIGILTFMLQEFFESVRWGYAVDETQGGNARYFVTYRS
jgi:hypothetical protein